MIAYRLLKHSKLTVIALGLIHGVGCTTLPPADRDLSKSDEALVCAGAPYDEFDFWIGDWDIVQTVSSSGGKALTFPASNSVRKSENGCTITENWKGVTQLFWYGMTEPESIWGYSARRVDTKTGQWALNWMDSQNPYFGPPFVGEFESGVGLFIQESETRTTRIRFEPMDNGTVEWSLDMIPKGQTDPVILWRMTMVRTEG